MPPNRAERERIVEIAIAQIDRGVTQVRASGGEVEPLARYLRPQELWCSDFVSWVYQSAGRPFTGGYQGGWMLTNNRSIRRWFERRDRWIRNGGPRWQTYAPEPGDYLRFHTTGGGHSGIVHHVEGPVLFTVEGNVGQRVRYRRYPDFRRYARIDGFGSLSAGPER
ncbi:MAG: CHAP domain-containing protein [Myxococcales bacterium]|nr:CHAP domain-containing protein [Myxococcales bacterium]